MYYETAFKHQFTYTVLAKKIFNSAENQLF